MFTVIINIIFFTLIAIIAIPIILGLIYILPIVVTRVIQFAIILLVIPGIGLNYLLKEKLKLKLNEDWQSACIVITSLIVDTYLAYLFLN